MVRSVTFRALLVFALVGVSLLLASSSSVVGTARAELEIAGPSTTWETGFQLQNLGTSSATVTIEFIPRDNPGGKTTVNVNIPAGSARVIYSEIPTGFFGSVRVSSTQPLAAIANMQTANPKMNGSYSGFTEGATTVYLPIILKNYYPDWYTTITVQNVDDADANVQISFKPQEGAAVANKTRTIAPGAMWSWDQSTDTAFGTTRWVGSATVTSTNGKKLAVVVNQIKESGTGSMQTYNGFSSGATKLFVPIVLNAYYGFNSAVQVQNIGASPTNITITYSDGKTFTRNNIAAGAATTFLNFQEGHAAGWVGSATITSSGQPIVAIINQSNASNGRASSFNAVSAGQATTKVVAPAIYKNYYGWSTALQVQNVGTAPTNITVTYSNGKVRTHNNLAVGASALFLNFLEDHPMGFAGSAVVTSSGQPIVAVVNQEIVSPPAPAPIPGDWQQSYNGTNVAP